MDGFQREVLERLKTIEVKIDDYKEIQQTAKKSLEQSNINSNEIAKIQDNLKWTIRTVVGSIISGIIGLVFILLKINL
jgi:phage protein|nr:MAG TPA: hemolysin [Caudoviricetes sp.]